MTRLTVLAADAVAEIEAEIVEGRPITNEAGVHTALGWEVEPEGLCRGDVCVPVRDDAGVRVGDGIDLTAAAELLGRSTLLDVDAAVIALSAPAADRRAALKDRVAPDFTLPDLEGRLHTLEHFKDRKRLLIAFASW